MVRNDEWTWEEAFYYIYEERAFDNIVISPGPGSPACPADVGKTLYFAYAVLISIGFARLTMKSPNMSIHWLLLAIVLVFCLLLL